MFESTNRRPEILKIASTFYLGFSRESVIDMFSFALSPLYRGQQVARELRVDPTGRICWNFSREFLSNLGAFSAN